MEPSVFVGIDSGKARHHVVGLDTAGASVLDQPVANDEAALVAIFQAARAIGAPVVCVDQPGSIGALTVAVAQAQGLPVVYLPGRRMRHVAETFAGQAKTDVRDARIIAETARSMPHAVRPLVAATAVVAELRVVCGVDDDLVKQLVAGKNRIRGLLTSAMPGCRSCWRNTPPRRARNRVIRVRPNRRKAAAVGYFSSSSGTPALVKRGPMTRSSAGMALVSSPRMRFLPATSCFTRSSSTPHTTRSSATTGLGATNGRTAWGMLRAVSAMMRASRTSVLAWPAKVSATCRIRRPGRYTTGSPCACATATVSAPIEPGWSTHTTGAPIALAAWKIATSAASSLATG